MAVISELMEAEELVRAHPEFQARDGPPRASPTSRRSRSTPGRPAISGPKRRRVSASARCVAFVKPNPGDSEWARPVDGVIVLVDLNKLEVLRVDDHGVVPIPPESGNFDVDRRRAAARRHRAARDHAARGPGLRARRARPGLAALAGARRVHPARGPRAQPGRLRRRGAAALDPATGRRSPKWSCPTATRARATTGRTRSTAARTASASPRRRSRAAATAWARSSTSTRSCRTPPARPCRSRTRSASTRRTSGCSGATSSGATARARCAGRDDS